MANPVVTFTMADGKVMKAELYPEVAPNTVCTRTSDDAGFAGEGEAWGEEVGLAEVAG